MKYPEPDAAVISAAHAKRASFFAAIEQTRLNISDVELALRTTTDEKSRLLDMMAAGQSVPPRELHEVEAGIARNEASLGHQREILARQEAGAKDAEAELRKSNGMAQRPRVVTAIRELYDAGQAAAAARRAQIDAENRLTEAKGVLTAAFGAGFPAPQALRPTHGTVWTGYRIPDAPHTAALRAVWGDLAEEALASSAEPAAA